MAEKFEEKTPGEYDKFEKKGELWTPKEERGHIQSPEELEKQKSKESPEKEETRTREEAWGIYQKRLEGKPGYEHKNIDNILKEAGITPNTKDAREFMEKWDWKQAKKTIREKDWEEAFTKLGGTRGKERIKEAEQELVKEQKAVASAEIPRKGMGLEEILKEAGIQKPAESFDEVQKRLGERLEKTRVGGGEKLSLADKNEITRDFYLGELGYSVKYKGLLRGKAELLDKEGKSITDEKGKSLEFKTFFKLGRKETPMTDFLKEELKGKLEGKPEKKLTEEEKWEAGTQKAIKETEREQERREEKISSLADVKRVGKERLSKLVEGLSYVAALDKLGVLGLREGKKLAIEGGKDLAAIGLSPAVAIEEVGREITGRIQVGEALRKTFIAERKLKTLEGIPEGKRPEYYTRLTDVLKETSQKGTEEMVKGYDKIFKKGKILRFLEETWGGRFGKAMGERLTPHPSKKEKYE